MKTSVTLITTGPLKKTLWPILGYQRQGDIWRFISLQDTDRREPNGAAVGPHYPSEKVLLADMRHYAKSWGLE